MTKTDSKNKLSRTYRFKKKTGKITKKKELVNNQLKKARIVIRNLSFKTTDEDIRKLFGPFGEIEEIKLLKRPDGNLVGCGFVQFKKLTDASKAIFKTNKSEFLGRIISSEWAIPKTEFSGKLKQQETPLNNNKNRIVDDENRKELKNSDENIEELKIDDESITELKNNDVHKNKKKFSKKNEVSKAEQRKLQKIKKRQKRSRIIIRNLPFTVTEESITEHFNKYGSIEELKLLKKPDGSPTGCCFLQFARVQSAAQCIHHENMKSFLNRSIIVDWAIPKDKFQKSSQNDINCKSEKNENDEILIKDEDTENYNVDEIKIKEEIDDETEIEPDIKEDIKDSAEEQSNDESEDDTSNNDDDDNGSIKDKKDIKLDLDDNSKISHPRHISNDVNEGKTVFLKNVPFSATNEDLKQCMTQFGPIYYALICIDPLTEHSKGTAFVKFKNIEDAEKCLASGTELQIHNQTLDPHKAVNKNELKQKTEQKSKNIKDSRNLYLVKEGVVLASSAAAQDISPGDMARRLQLEQWKSQILRNLNMFVSRVRLVIHNLPTNTDDAKLRQLFKNHSNSSAVITEARVMRDLKNVDANGIGKSKEYGFVSFTRHEDALKALRSLNNNPNIFTKTKRPIVAFSIENRVMVNAKKRRVERSRQHNPLCNNQKKQTGKDQVAKDEVKGNKHGVKRRKKSVSTASAQNANTEDVESFAGTTSKPGENNMSSKFFIKKQANLYTEKLKQRKKKLKNLKQMSMQRKEQALNKREAKPKQGSKNPGADEANFNRIVNNYRSHLSSSTNLKTKWYES